MTKAIKKVTLPNGLRIVLVPQAGVASTALILVAAGSEYETKRINGLSHFLEHMVFKGTVSRPEPGMTAEALDALGAEYNAFTSQEYTGYWAKAENHKLPGLLDLVSDLYLNPLFNQAEIDKERGVVIEELNMYEDMPMRKVQDVFLELLYGDQPAGWDVGGTKDVIRKMQRRDFADYRKARYVASGTVVVVSGDFDAQAATRFVRQAFGKLPRKNAAAKPKTIDRQRQPKFIMRHKASDQSHLVLGLRTFSLSDQRRYAAEVLAHTLGGGMSSRLFIRIREKMGAAYYVRAESALYLDHGYLALSSGANTSKLEAVTKAILEECARLAAEPIGAAELKRVKDHLVGTFMLALETSDQVAGYYAEQELLLRTLERPEAVAKRFLAVTAEDVRDLARKTFRASNLNLAVIGPKGKERQLQKLLRF